MYPVAIRGASALATASRPALRTIISNAAKIGPKIKSKGLIKGLTIGYLADQGINAAIDAISSKDEAHEARRSIIDAMEHASGEEQAALAEIANALITLYPTEDYDDMTPERALHTVEHVHHGHPAPPLRVTDVDRDAIKELDRMQKAWSTVRRGIRLSVEEIFALKAVLSMSLEHMDLFEERMRG